mgnify:CR=1 FL=1
MNFTITKVQLFLMLFFRTTGIIFIAYPEILINAGGRDSWIMFLITAVIIFFSYAYMKNSTNTLNLGN